MSIINLCDKYSLSKFEFQRIDLYTNYILRMKIVFLSKDKWLFLTQ